MDDAVRMRKVAAVEGLLGSSVFVPFQFLALTLLAYQLFALLAARNICNARTYLAPDYDRDVSLPVLARQFLLLCLPYILFLLGVPFLPIACPFIIAIVFLHPHFRPILANNDPQSSQHPRISSSSSLASTFPTTPIVQPPHVVATTTLRESRRIPYLIPLRALLMLTTISAILAVDFPSFPRSFAKTEVSGYSIMDLGVGLFIFSAGIVINPKPSRNNIHDSPKSSSPISAAAAAAAAATAATTPVAAKIELTAGSITQRRTSNATSINSDSGISPNSSTVTEISNVGSNRKLSGSSTAMKRTRAMLSPSRSTWSLLRGCLIVGTIGICRTIVVKMLNYQEHIGEYGVHWNFFITLMFVPLLGAIFRFVAQLTHVDTRFLAAFIALLYEYFLQTTTLQDWLISNGERNGWIESNKEGIFSTIGYLVIYLYAMGVNTKLPVHGTFTTFAGVFRHFYIVTVISLLYLIRLEPSRRLANSAYTLWVVWSSLFHLIGCIFVTVVTNRSSIVQQPYLFRLVNSYQLYIFLAANVATGLVNMTLDVFSFVRWQAIVIVSLYTFGVVAIFHLWNRGKPVH